MIIKLFLATNNRESKLKSIFFQKEIKQRTKARSAKVMFIKQLKVTWRLMTHARGLKRKSAKRKKFAMLRASLTNLCTIYWRHEWKGRNIPWSEKRNITTISKLKTYSTVLKAKPLFQWPRPQTLRIVCMTSSTWHVMLKTRSFQCVKTFGFEFSSTNGLFYEHVN